MYVEELRSSINLLMANLESLPVAKDLKPKIKPKLTPMNSFLDIGDENDLPLSKSDVVLSFTLEVSEKSPTLSLNVFLCFSGFSARGTIMWSSHF